jgi:hypothetical protein
LFNTEPEYDFVTIYECGSASCSDATELLKHSGSLNANSFYTSTTGFLKVTFTSDYSVTGSGFTGTWDSRMCMDDENEETVVPTPPPQDTESALMEAAQKYPGCQCTRSWREIRQFQQRWRSGGLGEFMVEDKYEVWVCLEDNMCSTLYDWFCYVFNEQTLKFEAWGFNSELKLVESALK